MKKGLAGLKAQSLSHKLRQTQLLAYLSFLLNVTLLMTLVFVLVTIK